MKRTAKQIAALLGVALLVLMYLLLLVFAICDFEGSPMMFRVCLMATFIIPLLIWIYVYLYDRMKASRNGDNDDTRTTIHK
jgi:uncharacterized membrane protein